MGGAARQITLAKFASALPFGVSVLSASEPSQKINVGAKLEYASC